MVEICCPVSRSKNITKIESIKTGDIIRLYRESLSLKINNEFNNIECIDLYYCLDSDLFFFFPSVSGTELFYEMLQPSSAYYMDRKDEYDYAYQWIHSSDSVLEIGCGKAAFSDHLPTPYYCGLEYSQKAIEMGRKKGKDVRLESIQHHSKKHSEVYDVVCAFQVLEHVTEVDEFIRSSIDCLKPNGLLIYSTPSLDSFIRKIPNFALDMPPHHVTRWTDQALRNLAKYYPLQCIEVWHEPLQSIHQKLYLETISMAAFSRWFKISSHLIDFRMRTRVLTFLSRCFAKLILPGLNDEKYVPAGQTVVAIYRKTS